MDDVAVAKILLKTDGKIVDADKLPIGVVKRSNVEMHHRMPDFKNNFLHGPEEINKVSLEIDFYGSMDDIYYLTKMSNCVLIPKNYEV